MNDAHAPSRRTKGSRFSRFQSIATIGAACSVLSLSAVSLSSSTASAATLQEQAASISAQLKSQENTVGALGQQYNQDLIRLNQINASIKATKKAVVRDRGLVANDTVSLRQAAVNAYITNGEAAASNPLFSNNQKSFSATQEYSGVVQGTLSTALAALTNSQNHLAAQQTKLSHQQGNAQATANAAASSLSQAKAGQAHLQALLSSIKGQLAAEIAAQQAAAARTALAQAAQSTAGQNIPNPPSNLAAGERAVQYAMSQIGVPYVYAAATPHQGFDCSGLTMWAWGMAGVQLSHYSGAQMQESTPVSVRDLEPGDLLFFGPGGSEHVAMYIGGGMVIQAPYTGANVGTSSLAGELAWAGSNFVGAGRP